MGRRGSRHANVATLSGGVPNGVDFSSAPTSIPDGFALDMLNMYYPDQGKAPATRPGTEIVTWDGTATDDPIDAMYVWEKNAEDTFVIVAKGNKLYYIDDDSLTEIGALTSGAVPCFANFNQKLIIADGTSTALRYWDGSTYGTISGSPTYSTVCAVHAGRLWANSLGAGELDMVYASKAGDETEWDSADGAESIPTAYGSGLWVSALASFGSDLIVFKTGASGARQIFRINTSGTPDGWSGEILTSRSSAIGHAVVTTLGSTDVMFADDDGIKMLSGTDTYGDFSVVPDVGQRIRPRVTSPVVSLAPLAPWGGVLLLAGYDTCYLFHPHNGAWCPLQFECGTITAACSDSTHIYLGDNKGRIWRVSTTATDGYVTDALAIGAAGYPSYVHTPLQADSYGILLRRMNVLMKVLSNGTGVISVVGADLVTETQIAAWDSEDIDGPIYGDSGAIYGDTKLIFSTTEKHVRAFSRHRSRSLSIKIAATDGRFQVNQIGYEVALVNA